MNRSVLLVLVLMVSGCAVSTVSREKTAAPAPQSAQDHTFASAETIHKLMLGISREEALALIGRTAVTGYELKGIGNEYKPLSVANPYRSQKITRGSDVFVVDYYMTDIHKADGVVANDELTPLVFQADKLIGKGWDFFNSKIKP
jgi:hypothetical protein